MSNRLCVMFLPAVSAGNPDPKVFTVARGNFKCFSTLWLSCALSLSAELKHPQGSGHVFVGHENDSWIKNPSRHASTAKLWQGTMKSGSFEDFLRPHLESFLPELAEAAVPA